MTTNETENRISSAVESMIPEDSYASIVKKLSSAPSDERTVINMTAKKNNMVKILFSKIFLIKSWNFLWKLKKTSF